MVKYHQLTTVVDIAAAFGDVRFVLDRAGKLSISGGAWRLGRGRWAHLT